MDDYDDEEEHNMQVEEEEDDIDSIDGGSASKEVSEGDEDQKFVLERGSIDNSEEVSEHNSEEEHESHSTESDKVKTELKLIGKFARFFLSLTSRVSFTRLLLLCGLQIGADAIVRGTELCFKYFHSYGIKLVLPANNEERVKSFQVENELRKIIQRLPCLY